MTAEQDPTRTRRDQTRTRPTAASVDAFVAGLADERQRADSAELIALMSRVSGEQPVLWGPSIIGFGTHHYRYASGREGDTARISFSPRKGKISLYLTCDAHRLEPILARLGRHSTGVGCIYLRRLDDIDRTALADLIEVAWHDDSVH